jgi:hypothetical protein
MHCLTIQIHFIHLKMLLLKHMCLCIFLSLSDHGHPEPIRAPDGRARRSIALYYYTNGRPSDECLDNDCSGQGHSTLFQKPVGCEKCLDDTCRRDDTIGSPVWVSTTKIR